MAKHISSMSFQIVSVGFERDVRSFACSWVTKDIKGTQQKVLDLRPAEGDSCLAYADVVIMSKATPANYLKVLEWYTATIGKDYKKSRDLKPEGDGIPMIRQLRIYWYHAGTFGNANRNIGWADVLSSSKAKCNIEKIIREGHVSADSAYKVLLKIKASTDQGHHLTIRPILSSPKSMHRTLISSLASGKVYSWTKGAPGNRSDYTWEPKVHGEVVKRMVKHMEALACHDSGVDWMGDIVDESVSTENPIGPSGGEVRADGLIKKVVGLTGYGSKQTTYSLPDGRKFKAGDEGFFGVQAAYFKQDNKEEGPE